MHGSVQAVDAFRTPDERFDGLPAFPWQPRYRDWDGLRLAHLDEGDGAPVLLLHGEPTWSFLYRKVIPPLIAAGHRCVVPDLPGFGRSDKPTDVEWYSYDRHTEAVVSLVEALDLRDVTLVCQDWGGPIGLRAAATERTAERFARFVVMNTGVFTGSAPPSDNWLRFRDFVTRNEDLPIARLIVGALAQEHPQEVIEAYEAPFPTPESKAGARAFPRLVATSPDHPEAAKGRAVAEALRERPRPTLMLWGVEDFVLPLDPLGNAVKQHLFPHADGIHPIEGAHHFLQEDQGERIGELIRDWLAGER